MKKISLALLAGTLMFASCKKGENDPSISLVSRKARVAGEWNIDKYAHSYTDVSSTTTTATTTTFEGTAYTRTQTNTSGSTSTTTTVTGTIAKNMVTFEKEGTFKTEREYTTVETDEPTSGVTVQTTTTYTQTTEGSWNFLGKVDEFKSKERIILNTTSESGSTKEVVVTTVLGVSTTSTSQNAYTNTYADGENSQVWALDRLASDEMIVKQEENDEYVVSNTVGGTTVSNTYTGTGTLEITLSQE